MYITSRCVPITVKSQENGTSESSSPTLVQQQSQTKSKEHTDTKPTRSNKDSNSNGTNGQTKKKDKKHKANSNDEDSDSKPYNSQPPQSVFESETQNFLSNELDELESDRHSLLENHDLLDNSDHSLLEDDNTHNLLNDANNEVMMMQRHREMLAGLVETNHILPHLKSPLVNGYGLLDRDTMSYIGKYFNMHWCSVSICRIKCQSEQIHWRLSFDDSVLFSFIIIFVNKGLPTYEGYLILYKSYISRYLFGYDSCQD